MLLVILFISGCVQYSSRSYVNPVKENYKIEKIMVSPFSAPTEQLNAGKYIANLLVFKLLSSGFVIVTKEDEADAVIEGVIGEYGYNKQNIENVNVFIGTSSYEIKSLEELVKIQTKPVCALTIRLTESKSGMILWASSFTADSSFTTIISEALEELTDRMVREITEIFRK
ncbi:MAG: hypothetical protein AB1397_04820 [bacterium]